MCVLLWFGRTVVVLTTECGLQAMIWKLCIADDERLEAMLMAGNLRLAQEEHFLLLHFDSCEQEYASRLSNKGYWARHFTELFNINFPVTCIQGLGARVIIHLWFATVSPPIDFTDSHATLDSLGEAR